MSLIGTLGNLGARAGVIAPFAISASMAVSACSPRPAWESFVSPHFPTGAPPAVNEVRIPTGDRFTLIDDGDGIYRAAKRPDRDRWEEVKRGRIPNNDPALNAFLKGLAVNEPALFGTPVLSLANYLRKAPALFAAFANSLDEESAWSSYQELLQLRVQSMPSTPTDFRSRAIALAGPSGCFVPLREARTAASKGEVEAMNADLKETAECAKAARLTPEPDLKGIRLAGYRTAIMATIAKCESDGDALAMVNKLLELGRNAERDNVADQALFQETAKRAAEALRASIRIASESAEVKTDLASGSIVLLDARISIIRSAAEMANIGNTIADDIKRARTAGYLEALKVLRAQAADPAKAEDVKKKLDAMDARGRALGGEVLKELQEIRKVLRNSGRKK